MRRYSVPSEHQKKRSMQQRMVIVHAFLFVIGLVIVARLMELQVLRGGEYLAMANDQHFGGVVLPAKRGEILSLNSKNGETNILATNTTLDLVYVDPLVVGDPVLIAETLSDILLTEQFYEACSKGEEECPRELMQFFAAAFDPMESLKDVNSQTLLEPVPDHLPTGTGSLGIDLPEARRLFARDIERRIEERKVTFVPLVYGATKIQMQEVAELNIAGVEVIQESKLIYANPEQVEQGALLTIARRLSPLIDMDPSAIQNLLTRRDLRYVPVMRRLPPTLSSKIREKKIASINETLEKRKNAATREEAQEIRDPLRSIALIPEHWRYYPDTTVASHVVGFLNTNQEAQYGIERAFNAQLRGQEGMISTVNDPLGGQIATGDQTIVDPKDGDTIVLTIDRFIQKEVETILDKAVKAYDAQSAQVIVMEPKTGRILAMVNSPLYDSNNYANVYEKEPLIVDEGRRQKIVVELYHPETRAFVLRVFYNDLFTEEGRKALTEENQKELASIEELYELKDVVRYYLYIGETQRMEIFPTDRPDIWLKFKNEIGVGAYLNRNVQEIYEPGSVMKPITMAIAIDQGEVVPEDTYNDKEPVKVDEYTIKNALNAYYGVVTMTNCIEFSINTCMTTVSTKLGKKLFHRMITRFGFGQITGVELEDELPGEVLPWKRWSNSLLATSSYGQGISATPLQVATAFAALANDGKLMRPTIIDSIIKSDGTVEKTQPRVVDQVITPETADTITAMLVSSVRNGFADVAAVPGYSIAGKTGTSQIAGPGGKYETGTGSTIATFAGYAPPSDPRFLILVKFDRPIRDIYGSATAGPVFRDVAAFLFKYYGIPPNE